MTAATWMRVGVGVGVLLGVSAGVRGDVPTFTGENALPGIFSYVRQVAAADLDGDGHLDLVCPDFQSNYVRWYQNDGGTPTTFTDRSFIAPATVQHAAAGDLDGDGDLDLVCSFPNIDRVSWYENDGGTPPTFTEHVIADGVHAYPYIVEIGDLDGDTHPDILCNYNSDSLTVWYESDGAVAPATPTFTERAMDPDSGFLRGLAPTDVDGDGDMDVMFSGFEDFVDAQAPFGKADGVGWMENLGGSPVAWAKHEIETDATYQNGYFNVIAEDMNGDGLPDAVCTLYGQNLLAWFENPNASRAAWTRHTIDQGTLDEPQAMAMADIDQDGDVDVVAPGRINNVVAWFERGGTASAPTWTPHVIPTTLERPEAIEAADLTGDGFPEIAVGWVTSKTVTWYQNVPPATCVGDIDGNGTTDVFDFGTLAVNFGTTGLPPYTGGDLDGDGAVTVFDFGIFAVDFGCPGP